MSLDGIYFWVFLSRPTGWTHVVMNYIGPNNGEGIKVYYNGEEVASDTTPLSYPCGSGDGRIVLGRAYTAIDKDYSSIEIDELTYFNRILSTAEMKQILRQ